MVYLALPECSDISFTDDQGRKYKWKGNAGRSFEVCCSADDIAHFFLIRGYSYTQPTTIILPRSHDLAGRASRGPPPTKYRPPARLLPSRPSPRLSLIHSQHGRLPPSSSRPVQLRFRTSSSRLSSFWRRPVAQTRANPGVSSRR